ncbi:MAG: methyltransferase domain-containing protein, partial [Blastocatellia bacterium]|nr:methyltransferase domain-containing protein [Blastocatellia bacterium]
MKTKLCNDRMIDGTANAITHSYRSSDESRGDCRKDTIHPMFLQYVLLYFRRKFGRTNNRLIERYFSSHEIRKLHLGCETHVLDGWLNSDLFPGSEIVLQLDATEPFPFGDEEFDYIFSEHMIEHITYSQGLQMLFECYRVLKNNGKIRISTPDLAFLIDLYNEEKSYLQKDYIKWSTDRHIRFAPGYDDTFVINNFVRNWGHQFIYDEKVLSASLQKVGFTKITRCE